MRNRCKHTNQYYHVNTDIQAMIDAEEARQDADFDEMIAEDERIEFGIERTTSTTDEEKPNYLIIGLVTIAIAVGAYLIYNNINKAKQ